MSEAANIDIIKQCYAAYGRQDIAAVMAAISDQLDFWGTVSDARQKAPWHVANTTKAEVPSYFERVAATMEPLEFNPRVYAAAGEHVFVCVDMRYRVRTNGRILNMHVIHHFTLADGKITSARISEDTAHSVEIVGAGPA